MSRTSLQDEELWLQCQSKLVVLGLPLARLEVKIWLDLLPLARRENVSIARKLADSLSGLELWIEYIQFLGPQLLGRVAEDVDCLVLDLLARVGKLLRSAPQFTLRRATRATACTETELNVFLEKIDYLTCQTDDEASESECSDSETDEDASTSYKSLGELSTSLSTAVSCLGQLKLAIELSCTSNKAEITEAESSKRSHSQEEIPQEPIDYFTRLILARFDQIDLELAKRLGKISWQRWERLQKLSDHSSAVEENDAESVIDVLRPEPKSSINPPTTFIDSGLGTSIPTLRSRHQIPVDVRSLASTGTLPHRTSLELPPAPREIKEGKPFKCVACRQLIHSISSERQWRKHLFEDLQPYTCCRDPCSEACITFSSSGEWIQHDIRHHRSQHDLTQTCPLCKDFTSNNMMSYASHVASHLESISLSALPSGTDDSDESSDGSTTRSDHSPVSANKQDYIRDQLRANAIASPLHPTRQTYELDQLDTAAESSDTSANLGVDTSRLGGVHDEKWVGLIIAEQEALTGFRRQNSPERDSLKNEVTMFAPVGPGRYRRPGRCRSCELRRVRCFVQEGCVACDECTAGRARCTWYPADLCRYLNSTVHHTFHSAFHPWQFTDISVKFRKRMQECAQLHLKFPDTCPKPTGLNVDSGIWHCPRCEDSFSDKSQWIDHISYSDPKEFWWCPDHDSQFFTSADAARLHMGEASSHPTSTRLIAMHYPSLLNFRVEESARKRRMCPYCHDVFSGWNEYYERHLPSHFLTSRLDTRRREQQGASGYSQTTTYSIYEKRHHRQDNALLPGSIEFASPLSLRPPARPLSSNFVNLPSLDGFVNDKEESQIVSKQRDADTNISSTIREREQQSLPSVSVESETELKMGQYQSNQISSISYLRDYLHRKQSEQCLINHTAPGPFLCLRYGCMVTFADKQAWIRHQEGWDPPKLWWCSDHPKEFHHRRGRLDDHLRLNHSFDPMPRIEEMLTPVKIRTCPICRFQSANWDFFYRTHVAQCMKAQADYRSESEETGSCEEEGQEQKKHQERWPDANRVTEALHDRSTRRRSRRLERKEQKEPERLELDFVYSSGPINHVPDHSKDGPVRIGIDSGVRIPYGKRVREALERRRREAGEG